MKKESYRHNLPHFQQPGQAYFVTWILKDAVPKRALVSYSKQLEDLKLKTRSEVADSELQQNLTNPIAADRNPLRPVKITDWNPPFLDEEAGGISAHPDEITGRNLPHSERIVELKQEYQEVRKKYIHAYNQLLDQAQTVSIDLSQSSITDMLRETLLFWENVKLRNYAFCIMPNHVHWVFTVFEKDSNGKPVYLQDIMYSVKRFSAGRINKLLGRKGAVWQKESFDTTIRDNKHLYHAVKYTLDNPVNAGFVADRGNWPGNFLSDNF